MYRVAKTFPHSLGLSCCFRQWRAGSHCRFLHGYALEVEIGIISETLDARHWCFDFGDFKRVHNLLREAFDHKTIVAKDDPELETFRELDRRGLCQLRITDHVGCEAFAEFIFGCIDGVIHELTEGRAFLGYVTVREHGANSSTYAKNP